MYADTKNAVGRYGGKKRVQGITEQKIKLSQTHCWANKYFDYLAYTVLESYEGMEYECLQHLGISNNTLKNFNFKQIS